MKLDNLPTEVIQKFVLPYLSDDDVNRCSRVSWRMFRHCKSKLISIYANHLLAYVVKGAEEKALAILEKYPHLLLITATANDYSDGRTIQQTAFKAALSAGNVSMARKMLPFFDRVEGIKPGEALRQYDIVFPQGLEVHFQTLKRQAYNFNSLIDAFINGEREGIKRALLQFQGHMKHKRVVTEGAHFNLYDLINAVQLYVNNPAIAFDTQLIYIYFGEK